MGVSRGIGRILAGLVLAAGLGACATSPDGLRYADGSYYAPAGDGRGDYYVGRAYDHVRYLGDPFFDDYLWPYGGPWYGGWYGSRFDGYCSVRYRYCPGIGWGWSDPFPRHGFAIYFGDPWGYGHRWRDPWYDARPYDRWRPPPRPRQAPAPAPRGDDLSPPDSPKEDWLPSRQPEQRPPRRVRDPMSNEEDPVPRARRTAPPRRDPPPPPRAKDQDGDGN